MSKFESKFYWSDFLFSFEGRISRKQFWVNGHLMVILPLMLVSSMMDVAFGYMFADGPVSMAMAILLLWPSIAISVKRWHDRDKSGWWVFIVLVPIIGLIWALIEIGFTQGTIGPNRFGKDPLM